MLTVNVIILNISNSGSGFFYNRFDNALDFWLLAGFVISLLIPFLFSLFWFLVVCWKLVIYRSLRWASRRIRRLRSIVRYVYARREFGGPIVASKKSSGATEWTQQSVKQPRAREHHLQRGTDFGICKFCFTTDLLYFLLYSMVLWRGIFWARVPRDQEFHIAQESTPAIS